MPERDDTRRSAAERRQDILTVARGHFAKVGDELPENTRMAAHERA
jgi:hypothetical protein